MRALILVCAMATPAAAEVCMTVAGGDTGRAHKMTFDDELRVQTADQTVGDVTRFTWTNGHITRAENKFEAWLYEYGAHGELTKVTRRFASGRGGVKREITWKGTWGAKRTPKRIYGQPIKDSSLPWRAPLDGATPDFVFTGTATIRPDFGDQDVETYDAGRLASTSTTTNTYDANGRLVKITGPYYANTFAYDGDRVVRETSTGDWIITTAYDKQGRAAKRVENQHGAVVRTTTYSYDCK